MISNKDKAYRKILEDFNVLSRLTIRQMKLLSKVLTSEPNQRPESVFHQLMANEDKLDQLEVKISNRIIKTIVLYHPVATELRNIMACYRMITNLERIGDLVMKAYRTLDSNHENALLLQNIKKIDRMLSLSRKMVLRAVDSFLENDLDSAMWTLKNDAMVDTMHQKTMTHILEEEDLNEISRQKMLDFGAVKSVISRIERMADHAAHIAEASIYAHNGEDIRHAQSSEKKEEEDEES